MITIDQLLESVDLDFEPRFVTKNKNGGIYVWATRPHYRSGIWFGDESVDSYIAKLKLAEFEGKSSGECIYEVPRKITTNSKKELVGKIEKLETTEKQRFVMLNKINEIIDWINDNHKDSK